MGQAVRIALSLGATGVFTRLLDQEAIGLVGMVAALIAASALYRNVGLSVAVLQRGDLRQHEADRLFWLNAGLGILLTVGVTASAPLVAWFFGEPRLLAVTPVVALGFLFAGLGAHHRLLLQRRLRFRELAWLEVVAQAVGVVAGIGTTLAGGGYWGLVVMPLASSACQTAVVWLLADWQPRSLGQRAPTGSLVGEGGSQVGTQILYFVVRNADDVMLGWRAGAVALGSYSVAYRLVMLPLELCAAPFQAVVVAALCHFHDDEARYRRFFLGAVRAMLALSLPVAGFLLVDATRVVAVCFGASWSASAVLLWWLGPAVVAGPLGAMCGWYYTSTRQIRREFAWSLVTTPAVLAAFLVGSAWGAHGMAAASSLAFGALLLPLLFYCFAAGPVRPLDVLRCGVLPTAATLVAAFLVAGLNSVLDRPDSLASLLVDVLLYLAAYLGAWLVPVEGRAALRGLKDLLLDASGRAGEAGR